MKDFLNVAQPGLRIMALAIIGRQTGEVLLSSVLHPAN
jgi:hypothetical protein